jgi:mono/diheme cytochrome c family protein
MSRELRPRVAPATTLTLTVALSLLALASARAQSRPAPPPADVATRGQYLVRIMDCTGCHTPGALLGKPDPERFLGGSDVGFEVPGVGVVYPRNLTPDPEHGLGRWTDAEIIRAFRQGQSRDGRVLIPVMPWPSYATLTEADARAVVAYLRTLTPVPFRVPANVKVGEKPRAAYFTVVMPKP